jgi:hypothetical protein
LRLAMHHIERAAHCLEMTEAHDPLAHQFAHCDCPEGCSCDEPIPYTLSIQKNAPLSLPGKHGESGAVTSALDSALGTSSLPQGSSGAE